MLDIATETSHVEPVPLPELVDVDCQWSEQQEEPEIKVTFEDPESPQVAKKKAAKTKKRPLREFSSRILSALC